MYAFVDAHHQSWTCHFLGVTPSGCYEHRARATDPARRSAREQRDAVPLVDIARVYSQHHEVHGAQKVWKQLRREGIAAARCTVERLLRAAVARGWAPRRRAGRDGAPASSEPGAVQLSTGQPPIARVTNCPARTGSGSRGASGVSSQSRMQSSCPWIGAGGRDRPRVRGGRRTAGTHRVEWTSSPAVGRPHIAR